MSTRHVSTALLTLLLLTPTSAQAETFRVGFYNAPPLMIQHSNSGIYHDLLLQIGAISGDNFTIKYYSGARLQRLFELGKIDLEPGINPRWRQQSTVPGIYSTPFSSLDQVLLFRPGKAFEVTGPESLIGKQVGAIRGYIYPGYMQSLANGDIERIDVTDEPQLLRLLERGRVEQIFIDRVVQGYWVKKDPKLQGYKTSKPLNDTPIMLRLHPSKSAQLAGLNQALAQLQQQGIIERIFQKYR